MLKTQNNPQNFLRFGLARTKELLKDIVKVYDGIVVPANILLYQHKSTPAIIYEIDKPFFIDPMSYLFAQPFDRFLKKVEKGIMFKPSFDKLLKGYGLDPKQFVNDNSSLTNYLRQSDANLFSFIDSCMDFQWNRVDETINKAEEYIGVEKTKNTRPTFIIPPYFLYKDNDIDSEMNFRILDYCDKFGKDKWNGADIFPMVFVDNGCLLNPSYLEKLITRLGQYTNFNGFVLWVNDFEERYASAQEIKGLIKLVSGISQDAKLPIVMLFGGFFSMLLKDYGIKCISHGLAYSEHRNISLSLSSSSGPAPVRYYVSDLHQFLTLEKALEILRVRKDLICDCPICQRVIQSNPDNVINFQNQENLAILHFLYNRNNEKEMVGRLAKKDIISYLDYLFTVNNDLNNLTRRVGFEDRKIVDVSCLINWKQGISEN